MTANEAYKIIMSTANGLKAVSCYEYPSRFVFAMIPENVSDASGILMNPLSVDKTTKAVTVFLPPTMSLDEYEKGKEIESWDEKSAGENYIKHNSDMLNGVFVYKK